jgi:hypothetical protein
MPTSNKLYGGGFRRVKIGGGLGREHFFEVIYLFIFINIDIQISLRVSRLILRVLKLTTI